MVTLLSILPKKFQKGDVPTDLPELDTAAVIENFSCPGMERLLLPWIEKHCGDESGKLACRQLSTVLTNKWETDFKR